MRALVLMVVLSGGVVSAQYVSSCPTDPPPDSPCAGGISAGRATPPPSAGGSSGGPAGPAAGGAGVGGPRFGGGNSAGGGELTGDPVVVSNNTSYQRVVDFSINTGKANVQFERIYHSSTGGPGSNRMLENGIPTPFGHAPGLGFGLLWWHTWLSFIVSDGTSAKVFDDNGVRWDFKNLCTSTGCWLDFVGDFTAPGRIQTTATGFRYIRPGRNELVFEDKFVRQDGSGPDQKTHYFLQNKVS